jgi:hypothetical protein
MARNRNPAARNRFNSHSRNSVQVEDWNYEESRREYAASHPYSAANLPPLEALLESAEPIRGFRDWFLISRIPVELSRHTQIGKTMTRVVMDMLGYRPCPDAEEVAA